MKNSGKTKLEFLFIATNLHVVAHLVSGSQTNTSAQKLMVGVGIKGEGESLGIANAKLVCTSQVPKQDLAFVLIDSCSIPADVRANMAAVSIYSETKAPEKGSQVFAIGNPEGLTRSIAQGLYNGVRPEGIQFDAPISVGSSGGALISETGELLGITTGFVSNKDSQNLNFALPSYEIIQNLKQGQSTCKGF
jgi:S1-C subfamily serine protease